MIDEKEIVIRNATSDDFLSISELLKSFGMSTNKFTADEIISIWNRYSENNPYYKYFPGEVHFGWIMEHKGRTVGFFGSIPRVYQINDLIIPVSIASQWVISKEYRKYSYLLKDKYFLENPIPTKLVSSANLASGKIFEKYGGKKVPISSLQHVYTIPLRPSNIIKYYFKRYTFLTYLTKYISHFLPWEFQYKFKSKEIFIKEFDLKYLTHDYKEFWEKYIKNNKGFLASRDPEILNWFYNSGKACSDKTILSYCTEFNDIKGIGSLIQQPIAGNCILKRYIVIDLLAFNSADKKLLLKGLISHTFNKGADILEIQLPGNIRKEEIPVFCFKRKLSQFPAYYQTDNDFIASFLEKMDNWNISPFDGDSTLG